MAHFAEINEYNIVMRVVVVSNNELLDEDGVEQEAKGVEFCRNLLGGTWKQTSYNSSFRKNFASTGFVYDEDRDAFIPPKRFSSWVLNENTCRWEAPIPMPTDGSIYTWDDGTMAWVLLAQE